MAVERATKVSDLTKTAKTVPEKGYVEVVNSLSGAVTTVPESIVETLKASGYSVK